VDSRLLHSHESLRDARGGAVDLGWRVGQGVPFELFHSVNNALHLPMLPLPREGKGPPIAQTNMVRLVAAVLFPPFA
jgi:hypothetical protein